MNNIFIKHPNLGGESYLQHFGKALGFSCVSDRVKTLNEGMQKRREDAKKEMGN